MPKARLLSLTCHPTQDWRGADETLLKVYAHHYDELAQHLRPSASWQLHYEFEFGTQAVIEVWDRASSRATSRKELRGVHYIDRFRTTSGVQQASFTTAGAAYTLTYELVNQE